jgi:hypothetical protein
MRHAVATGTQLSRNNKINNDTRTAAQNMKNQLKPSLKNEKIEELKRKPMHGQFYRDLQIPSVDKENFWRDCVAQV